MERKPLTKQKRRQLLTSIAAIVLIAALFIFPASVQARKLIYAQSIETGQVVNNDVFLSGQQPALDGIVNGDVFIVGSEVAITGEVNGSVFILSETFRLSGKISGNLFVAAVDMSQTSESQIDRNLYALTLSLITEPESNIGRDMKTVAMSARLQGEITGNTIAIIGPWEIFKIFRDFFNQNIIGFNLNQSTVTQLNSGNAQVRSGMPYLASIRMQPSEEPSILDEYVLPTLKSLLYFVVVGGLVLLVFPTQFKGWAEKIQKEPLASVGHGILVLINGYLIPIIGLSLIIGLLLGLIFASLPSIGWIIFWLGMGILITLFTVFQIAVTYISKAIVAYLLGYLILSKLVPGIVKYSILPLLLGLVIYVLLASIPYLGFVIGLATTLFGLGAIWLGRKAFFKPAQVTTNVD